jgi:hypothetical protein
MLLADRTLDLQLATSDDFVRVMALHIRGDARCSVGDLGGLEDLEEALRLAEAVGEAGDIVTSHNYLAEWIGVIEGPAQAMVLFDAGLALAPMVADRALPGGFGRDVPFEVSSTLLIGADERLRQWTVRTFSVEGTARSSVSVTVAERAGSDGAWVATDYLGQHELISTAVAVTVEHGALTLTSSAARFRLGGRSVPIAGPLGAEAVTTHRWDEARKQHHIDVEVRHPLLGDVLAYRGYFDVEVTPAG